MTQRNHGFSANFWMSLEADLVIGRHRTVTTRNGAVEGIQMEE